MNTKVQPGIPSSLLGRLESADHIAVLTGAGVSAESGIPTFRDAQTGLWAQYDPMTLASPQGFAENPALVWRWYQWRRGLTAIARPNPGHDALAMLERKKPELKLITQNVDGLHQQAGSRYVLELHGNIGRTICSITGQTIDQDWLDAHADQEPPPSPHHADGLGRPDVVWFGEALDKEILNRAVQAADQCDLMIVAGTAGVVQPAASLPAIAKQAGASLVDINPEPTEISLIADWKLRGTSAEWLPRIAASLTTAGGND
ncbi:MAG: NAD-dependent deacylase [Pseudomonadota bacterium]